MEAKLKIGEYYRCINQLVWKITQNRDNRLFLVQCLQTGEKCAVGRDSLERNLTHFPAYNTPLYKLLNGGK